VIRLALHPPDLSTGPLARLERRMPGLLRQALEQALEEGLRAARDRMGQGGPRVRSGRLLRSLGWSVSGSDDQLQGELYTDTPYAGAQEYGATILARRAEYLKFQVQGRWVQVRRVTLPARPYLRPGAEAVLASLEKHLTRFLSQELS
jgi:phage gpG-like protein